MSNVYRYCIDLVLLSNDLLAAHGVLCCRITLWLLWLSVSSNWVWRGCHLFAYQVSGSYMMHDIGILTVASTQVHLVCAVMPSPAIH